MSSFFFFFFRGATITQGKPRFSLAAVENSSLAGALLCMPPRHHTATRGSRGDLLRSRLWLAVLLAWGGIQTSCIVSLPGWRTPAQRANATQGDW